MLNDKFASLGSGAGTQLIRVANGSGWFWAGTFDDFRYSNFEHVTILMSPTVDQVQVRADPHGPHTPLHAANGALLAALAPEIPARRAERPEEVASAVAPS